MAFPAGYVVDMHYLTKRVAEAEARKRMLGVDESPAAVEAMRNKGSSRTAAKRAALARNEARARAAGRAPITAYY